MEKKELTWREAIETGVIVLIISLAAIGGCALLWEISLRIARG